MSTSAPTLTPTAPTLTPTAPILQFTELESVQELSREFEGLGIEIAEAPEATRPYLERDREALKLRAVSAAHRIREARLEAGPPDVFRKLDQAKARAWSRFRRQQSADLRLELLRHISCLNMLETEARAW